MCIFHEVCDVMIMMVCMASLLAACKGGIVNKCVGPQTEGTKHKLALLNHIDVVL